MKVKKGLQWSFLQSVLFLICVTVEAILIYLVVVLVNFYTLDEVHLRDMLEQ